MPRKNREPEPVFSSWDELSGDQDQHPHWQRLTRALRALGPAALTDRADAARRLLHETGVSYNVYGAADGARQPWPLDVVPLLIGSDDWAAIEAGLIQRAELLNLILTDLYGPRDILRRGLLPPALVYGHGGFLRACQDIRLPSAHQLPLYAADLVRDRAGQTWVLADRTQAPSGIGYALENRRVTSRVLPSLYREAQVHRQEPFLRALRSNLIAAAPPAARHDPALALLTPGAHNETYFEQALLAQKLGLQLVEGSDLLVQGGRLRLRALGGLTPIDVLWRRVDDAWCDPLELRADSFLGVPGLVEAARRRQVSVVNPLGSGVLENPALGAYLPALARHFLGEDLRLPSVDSYWCGDRQHLQHVLANLDRLVIKRLQRHPGQRSVFGATLSAQELAAWRERLLAQPAQYTAQAAVTPVPTPSFGGAQLGMRPVLLRAFLTAGAEGYRILPGGFARVGPQADTLFISNQAGAMGKDVWVLASEPETDTAAAVLAPVVGAAHGGLPRRAAENLFWVGRYLERSVASLRLLRLTLERLTDTDAARDPAALGSQRLLTRTLTHLSGTYPDTVDPIAIAEPLWTLLTDPRRPGSVAFDLQALAQAAETAREHLPQDALHLLVDLSAPLSRLPQAPADAEQMHSVAQQALHGVLALCGALAGDAPQDAGWHFLELGRCIERGQNLGVVLRSLLCSPAPMAATPTAIETALAFGGSLPAYRRHGPEAPALRLALELLLLDAAQPRSLMRQLQDIERHLAALPDPARGVQLNPSGRLALDAITRLRLLDIASLATADGLDQTALDQFLGRGDYLLRELSDAICGAHFQPPVAPHSLLRVPTESP